MSSDSVLSVERIRLGARVLDETGRNERRVRRGTGFIALIEPCACTTDPRHVESLIITRCGRGGNRGIEHFFSRGKRLRRGQLGTEVERHLAEPFRENE